MLALSGCQGSVSVGSAPAVKASDLEAKMVDTYSGQGITADEVSCPDDLKAEAGATTTCTITESDGTVTDFTITANSVDGTTVDYTIDPVDPSATP